MSQRQPLPQPGPLLLGGDLLIPKVIHRIWFGPMRQFHLDHGAAIRDMYEPLGWTVEEWGVEDVGLPFMPTDAIIAALRRKRYAQASDLMRYAIIHEHGGLYVDSDAQPVAPCVDALAGRSILLVPQSATLINQCYLGAVPGHPLLAAMLATLDIRLATTKGDAWQVTGPEWITQAFHDLTDQGYDLPLVPRDPWLPYNATDLMFDNDNERGRIARGEQPYPPGTLWAHHWNAERSKKSKRAANWSLNTRVVAP